MASPALSKVDHSLEHFPLLTIPSGWPEQELTFLLATTVELSGVFVASSMSCPKCKTMTMHYVETTKGHIKDEKVKQEHLCPGCESKIETKGAGKAAPYFHCYR